MSSVGSLSSRVDPLVLVVPRLRTWGKGRLAKSKSSALVIYMEIRSSQELTTAVDVCVNIEMAIYEKASKCQYVVAVQAVAGDIARPCELAYSPQELVGLRRHFLDYIIKKAATSNITKDCTKKKDAMVEVVVAVAAAVQSCTELATRYNCISCIFKPEGWSKSELGRYISMFSQLADAKQEKGTNNGIFTVCHSTSIGKTCPKASKELPSGLKTQETTSSFFSDMHTSIVACGTRIGEGDTSQLATLESYAEKIGCLFTEQASPPAVASTRLSSLVDSSRSEPESEIKHSA